MIKEDQSHLFIGSSRFIFDDLDAIPKRMVTSRIDDSAEGPTYLRMDADVPDEGLEGGLCQCFIVFHLDQTDRMDMAMIET